MSVFPQISVVSPLYLLLRKLHLINTYPGLILPYLTFAMPLTVWLLVGFFRQLPAGNPGAARLFINLLAAGRSATSRPAARSTPVRP